MPSHHHFNTSNVTIQLISHSMNSIKMGYFNTSNVTIQLKSLKDTDKWNLDFNTSNVTIQQILETLYNNIVKFQYI